MSRQTGSRVASPTSQSRLSEKFCPSGARAGASAGNQRGSTNPLLLQRGDRKYWSLKGRRINVPYTGSHRKVTIYGSLALDGRQFFRTYDRFNAVTFVAYLKELQRHFGKAMLIRDRAPQHRSKLVREFLRTNKNIRIMYFPKGSPYLNAVEEC